MGRYRTITRLLLAAAAIVLLATVAIGAAGIDDHRIVHFDFEDESVTDDVVPDGSGDGNHGEVVAADHDARDAVDDTDGTMAFADGGHHLEVPLDRSLGGDFTVTVDVRASHHGYFAGIVTSEEWWVVVRDDRYGFYTPETGIAAADGTADGSWRQVTAVHRDGTFELYLDGEFVDERDVGAVGPTETIYVGQRPDGYHLDGDVGSVAVYDRAATSGEVRALHAGSSRLPGFAFTDEFRYASALATVLLAVGAAGVEARRRGAGEPGTDALRADGGGNG